MNVKIYAAIYKKTSASGTSTLDPLPRYSYRLTLYTNPISDHIPIVCRNRVRGLGVGVRVRVTVRVRVFIFYFLFFRFCNAFHSFMLYYLGCTFVASPLNHFWFWFWIVSDWSFVLETDWATSVPQTDPLDSVTLLTLFYEHLRTSI